MKPQEAEKATPAKPAEGKDEEKSKPSKPPAEGKDTEAKAQGS